MGEAIAEAARGFGATCAVQPMADGGEGTLEAFGGPEPADSGDRAAGVPVDAGWRLDDGRAVIEMAGASGLELVGRRGRQRPDGRADKAGTGELISAAVEAGAREVLVGLGGSATTDGGLGALRAMSPLARFRGVELVAACDVTTAFVDAAEVFGPQKGASAAQVKLLRRRLERLVQVYRDEHGVDVADLPRAGAAGGLAGGLVVAGASLIDGFGAIAEAVDLYGLIEDADLVVTGEGRLDATSFAGKVVGGVIDLAAAANVPVLVIAGQVDAGIEASVESGLDAGVPVIDLRAAFGETAAMTATADCVRRAMARHLELSA
ncbi:MAG: glycerate kinase [Acidimicrobiales bacterium]